MLKNIIEPFFINIEGLIIINSIRGLKLQSQIVLESKGKNSNINRAELKKAHSMINPNILESDILKEYMNINKIVSYIDIDENHFSKWLSKKSEELNNDN